MWGGDGSEAEEERVGTIRLSYRTQMKRKILRLMQNDTYLYNHQKLEKGYADIEKGNVEDAASAFAAFRDRH